MKTKGIFRQVIKVYRACLAKEGEGFRINRPFPTTTLRHIDPFLLFDEMGPVNYGPGEAKGAPAHPHKGFETLTYLIEGEFVHKDSKGNQGTLQGGSAQWMTAGSGLVHSEMPSDAILKAGGQIHGIQLWVNLLKKDKGLNPRYQYLNQIPQAMTKDGSSLVKVVVGSALGVTSPLETRTPMTFLHVKTSPTFTYFQHIPSGFTVFVYVLSGYGKFGSPKVAVATQAQQMVLFSPLPGAICAENGGGAKEDLEFLIVAGTPLRENIVRHGYFVMNSDKEVQQAWEDYYNGKFGTLD